MIAPAGPGKTDSMSSPLNCLVTGASGYIGGRLVPELPSAGYAVRCMARDPGKLSDRPWSDDVEIAVADVTDGGALRRGRRDPRHLLMGDALDFWRVEAIEPGKLLRLRAEMKLPGLAWLELSVGQDYDGMTTYSQRAIFRPRGLAGHAYWRSISPFHGVVFGGMLKNITAAAEQAERAGDTPLQVTR